MVNSVVRPYFYDENGKKQATGERFWSRDYQEESQVVINIEYNRTQVHKDLAVSVSSNSIIPASWVTAHGNQDSIIVSINRPIQKYWNYQEVGTQGNFYVPYEGVRWETESLIITMYPESNAQDRAILSLWFVYVDNIECPYSTLRSQTVFTERCRAQIFEGNLHGTATKARYTQNGSDIGQRWQLYSFTLKGKPTPNRTYGNNSSSIDIAFGFSFPLLASDPYPFDDDDTEFLMEFLMQEEYFYSAWDTTPLKKVLQGWLDFGGGWSIPAIVYVFEYPYSDYPGASTVYAFRVITSSGESYLFMPSNNETPISIVSAIHKTF